MIEEPFSFELLIHYAAIIFCPAPIAELAFALRS